MHTHTHTYIYIYKNMSLPLSLSLSLSLSPSPSGHPTPAVPGPARPLSRHNTCASCCGNIFGDSLIAASPWKPLAQTPPKSRASSHSFQRGLCHTNPHIFGLVCREKKWEKTVNTLQYFLTPLKNRCVAYGDWIGSNAPKNFWMLPMPSPGSSGLMGVGSTTFLGLSGPSAKQPLLLRSRCEWWRRWWGWWWWWCWLLLLWLLLLWWL